MKKLFFLLFLAATLFTSCSDDDDNNKEPERVILDLSTFDLSHGIPVLDKDGKPSETEKYWENTYNAGNVNVQSQIFKFSHTANVEWNIWDGFTISNVTDNTNHNDDNNWIANQWGCMAQGGYEAKGSPFIIGYSSGKPGNDTGSFSEATYTTWVKIEDTNNNYKALGMYVCNHPYPYYAIKEGNTFANKFEKGSYLILRTYGIKDGKPTTDKPVEFYLADYRADDESKWSLNNSWKWVDLSALGEVDYIYFLMETSDVGKFGPNTPLYFCLDKITVEKAQ